LNNKKQNIIIALLLMILVALLFLFWRVFALEKKLELHEYWIRTALDMAK